MITHRHGLPSKPQVTLLLLGCLVITASIAQENAKAPAIQMPPQAPAFSASDLASKVPAVKAEDVKSMDAILRAIYDVISGPRAAATGIASVLCFFLRRGLHRWPLRPMARRWLLPGVLTSSFAMPERFFPKSRFTKKEWSIGLRVSETSRKSSAATNRGIARRTSLLSEESIAFSC